MQKFPAVILHRNKSEAVKRFHPWVFSGAIKNADKGLQAGDVVEVFSENGSYLGTGHYGTGSIAVRIFSFQQMQNLQELWVQKLQAAYAVRQTAGLTNNKQTSAYRIINAEGDGLPGL